MKPNIFLLELRKKFHVVEDIEVELEHGANAIASGGEINECEEYVTEITMGEK